MVLLSICTPVILYSKELLDTGNKIQNSGFNENTENRVVMMGIIYDF
jgi:hypothetical protein